MQCVYVYCVESFAHIIIAGQGCDDRRGIIVCGGGVRSILLLPLV